MATTSIYVQLKGGRPPRRIEATSLAWVFGRCTTVTALFSTGGTNVSIKTFMHRVESTPEPSAGAFTYTPATMPTEATTVGQEQLAIDSNYSPADPNGSGTCVQFIPPVYNTATAVASSSSNAGRNFAAPGHFQRILNESHYDYIRFTGTELPTGGIVIPRSDITAMFTATTSPTDL